MSHALNQKALLKNRNKDYVVPCGLDLSIFKPFSQDDLLFAHLPKLSKPSKLSQQLNLSQKNILFSSSFNNPVKNYSLLQSALQLMDASNIVVHELKNMSRVEVAEMMNKVDLCVMTSFSEGSPQFIKEAMACNCPIVSTNVGDVKEVMGNTSGCYVVGFDAAELAGAIQQSLTFGKRTEGRDRILKFDNQLIAKQIMDIYKTMLKK